MIALHKAKGWAMPMSMEEMGTELVSAAFLSVRTIDPTTVGRLQSVIKSLVAGALDS